MATTKEQLDKVLGKYFAPQSFNINILGCGIYVNFIDDSCEQNFKVLKLALDEIGFGYFIPSIKLSNCIGFSLNDIEQESSLNNFARVLKSMKFVTPAIDRFIQMRFSPIACSRESSGDFLSLLQRTRSEHRDIININGIGYIQVTMEIDFSLLYAAGFIYFVSSGGERERITIDLNSDKINKIYSDLLCVIIESEKTESKLKALNKVVNNLSSILESKLDFKVSKFICDKQKKLGTLKPIISIEEFIEEGLLICRHKALLVCALLAKLVNNKNNIIPTGRVYQYRTNLLDSKRNLLGAHSFCVFYNEINSSHYIIDPRWRLVLNLNLEKDFNKAIQEYGEIEIKTMLERFDNLPRDYSSDFSFQATP